MRTYLKGLLFWGLVWPCQAAALQVVTTLAPITDLVQRVAGAGVEVVALVPDGVNSHTFEPAPSDARILARADLIIANGLHLEQPSLRLAERVKRADTEIVRLGDRAVSPQDWRFDFSFPEQQGHPNPHLWPNLFWAMRYVELIRDALSRLDPAGRERYQANAVRLSARLSRLDAAVFACIDTIPAANRRLLTYHDSFAYFAPRYGLVVEGAVQPADFAEPSAREVARLIERVRQLRLPAIFGSQVFPSPVLAQISRESGARYVDQLRDDSLPGVPGEARHSYEGMMASNVRILTEALGGRADCLASVGW